MTFDETLIKDPRNCVGILADTLEIFLRSDITLKTFLDKHDLDSINSTVLVGSEFSRSSKKVLNGYKRKGTKYLYERAKLIDVQGDDDRWSWGTKRYELYGGLDSIGKSIRYVVIEAMKDSRNWYLKYRQLLSRYLQIMVETAEDFECNLEQIKAIECKYRFLDATDRNHRGTATRAAFEAAWFAKQYKFAYTLLE